MSKKQSPKMLDDVQVGDEVTVYHRTLSLTNSRRHKYIRIEKVTKRTPKTIEVDGCKYHIDGYPYYRQFQSRIRIPTGADRRSQSRRLKEEEAERVKRAEQDRINSLPDVVNLDAFLDRALSMSPEEKLEFLAQVHDLGKGFQRLSRYCFQALCQLPVFAKHGGRDDEDESED